MNNYLSWSDLEKVKILITNELSGIGQTEKWEPGAMAWETLHFKTQKDTYNLFVSCRQNNRFGLGIFKYPSLETLFNETIPFDENVAEVLHNILNSKLGASDADNATH